MKNKYFPDSSVFL